jgi:hypothetical protein
MSLHNFPMDTETCSLSLQSFAYGKQVCKEKVTRYLDTDEIVLKWDGAAIKDAKEKGKGKLATEIVPRSGKLSKSELIRLRRECTIHGYKLGQ